jgi:prephenate decarboxylase
MIVHEVNKSLKELEIIYAKQLKVFFNYLNTLSKIEIATLGPRGTSSEATGIYLLSLINKENTECCVYPSYEGAMESVISGKADLLLMANAYYKIDQVYMCPKLKLLTAFEYQTPYYGLAKKIGYQLPEKRSLKLATHHAPLSLLSQFIDNEKINYEVTLVESTSTAALSTQQGDFDLCITNLNSVQAYGLEFISKTLPIVMLWSVFGRA